MKFFEELTSKILWLVLGLILLSCGYLFVIKNFLNPPKISTIPAQTNPNPTANTPQKNPDPTPTDWKPNLDPAQTTIDPSSSPLNWQPNLNQISSSKVISVPRRLERGAVLSIYENEIKEVNPDPSLYQPKSRIEMSDLRLVEWTDSEFQSVSGFFFVPEDGTYKFEIEQAKLLEKYKERNLLNLSINGVPFKSYRGGEIGLQAGWHHVNLYFNPFNSYEHFEKYFFY